MRNLHSASVGAALPRGMRHSDTNDPCIAVEQRELTSVAPQERGPPRCGIRGGGLAAEGNLTGMGGAGEWFVGSGRGYDVPTARAVSYEARVMILQYCRCWEPEKDRPVATTIHSLRRPPGTLVPNLYSTKFLLVGHFSQSKLRNTNILAITTSPLLSRA